MPTPLSSTAPSAERRHAPRRQPAVDTVCRLSSSGKTHGVGLVWNISAAGISMLLHERMQPGTTIDIELTTHDQSFSLPRQIRVAHVRSLLTGDYMMGAQFLEPLAPEEMQRFIL
jgi:hypothetical protein